MANGMEQSVMIAQVEKTGRVKTGCWLLTVQGDDRRVLTVDGKHREAYTVPKAKESPVICVRHALDADTQPDAVRTGS